MAVRPKLPSINEILGGAKRVVTNLVSPITDDKGFIQRGQFTFQPIKQFLSVTPRGGFAAGIQRVKSTPLTSYFLPTAIQYGQTGLPRPIEQFAAHTQSALSFGLLRPKLSKPRTTSEKIAAYGGEIVGSIPAFTLGEAAAAPLAARLGSLPRIGRLAEVGTRFLGGGAAGFALTTPGGIKERAEAAKEQFTPSQLALSAPFIALGIRNKAEQEEIKRIISRAPRIVKTLQEKYPAYFNKILDTAGFVDREDIEVFGKFAEEIGKHGRAAPKTTGPLVQRILDEILPPDLSGTISNKEASKLFDFIAEIGHAKQKYGLGLSVKPIRGEGITRRLTRQIPKELEEMRRQAIKFQEAGKTAENFERFISKTRPEATKRILRSGFSSLKDFYNQAIKQAKPELKPIPKELEPLAQEERKRLKFKPEEVAEQEAGVLRTQAVLGEEEGKFKSVFDKWIGKRDVARTIGAEYGVKFRDIPKNKAKEFIDHVEGVKKSKDPYIIERAKEYKQITDTLYKDLKDLAKKAKYDLGYLNRYIYHIWKEDPQTVQKILSARKTRWGQRRVPTYEEGIKMGLTPKYNHPAEILSEYVRRIESIRANFELFEEMKKNGLVVPSSVGMNTPGFSPITAPGFPRSTSGYKGKVFEGFYYAPDSIANEINRLFQPENVGKTGKIFSKLATISRRMQDLILSGGIPKTPVNAFTVAQILKEVTSGSIRRPMKALFASLSPEASLRYFQENAEQIKKMQARNVVVRSTFDTQGLMGGGNLWDRIIADPTFKRFMPMLQIDLFNQVEKQALKKGLSSEKAADIAAKAVKNFYGLTDTGARARRSKIGQDIVTIFAFAPPYREAMINFWVRSLKALGRPFALENRQNLKFLVGAAITYGVMNHLNKVLNGHPMRENPKGKEDKLLIPVNDKVTLGVPFLSSIATVPRGLYRVLKRVLELDIKGAGGEALRTFGSVLIKPVGELVLNEDYFGRQIYDEDAKPLERGKQIASYLFRSNQHPYLRAALEPAGTPLYQRLGIATELPIRYYKTSSILNAPFWKKYQEAKKLNERLETLRYQDPQQAVEFYKENKEKIDSYKVLKEQVKAYYESGKNDKFLRDGGVAVADGHVAFVGTDNKFHLIDTNFDVEPPQLTGRPNLDKKLISSFKSEINAKKRNVVTLFENGILTADEAEALLQKLDTTYNKVVVRKAKIPKTRTTRLQLPALKATSVQPQKVRLSQVVKTITPIKVPAPVRLSPSFSEPLKLRIPRVNVSRYGNLRR